MTYRVEFWTRESNVIEVEAADINDLREKCDEMLYSPEHNYIWDNAEVADGGYKIIDNPEKQYEIRFIDGHDLPKQGEWIYARQQLEIVPMWECSYCMVRMPKKFNFCPNCGARMKVAERRQAARTTRSTICGISTEITSSTGSSALRR